MVLNITYETAVKLIRCMDEYARIPQNNGDRWFAYYAGKRLPTNITYGKFDENEDGYMGIIARVAVAEGEVVG